MASLYKVPAIFIVENNGVAMGTQVERSSAEKDLAQRGCGFAMPHYNIDGNDIDVVMDEMSKAADRARRGEGSSYIVANTYRFRGHSMSDPLKYRTKEEIERARLRDPITFYQSRLRQNGLLSDNQVEALEESVNDQIAKAFEQADADPHPPLESRFEDALAETYPYEPK
jgi:pyruvate dehydrogenase E1 component alpha subunit